MAKPSVKGKKPSSDQRLTVSIPKVLYAEVKTLADRDSRSLGWVIRKAIEKHIAEEQPLFHQNHGR